MLRLIPEIYSRIKYELFRTLWSVIPVISREIGQISSSKTRIAYQKEKNMRKWLSRAWILLEKNVFFEKFCVGWQPTFDPNIFVTEKCWYVG